MSDLPPPPAAAETNAPATAPVIPIKEGAKKGARKKQTKRKPTAKTTKKRKPRGEASTQKRYDWDKLLDGKTHLLKRGEDFTGTTSAAVAMIRYRARQRGVAVTAVRVDDDHVRIEAGEHPKPGRKKKA